MKPYFTDGTVELYHGDCLDVLRELPDNSVDAVCTDPPYGIRFMGNSWDGADIEAGVGLRRSQAAMPDDGNAGQNGGYRSAATEAGRYDLSMTANQAFQQWCTDWAIECLRILKPGGHLLSFGGSRTWHRLAAAIEDAGFEIRDSIAWLYGSGFPKSLDVSKAIDKAAGADREVVGTYQYPDGSGPRAVINSSESAQVYGDSRPGGSIPLTAPATEAAQQWQGWGTALKPAFEPIVVGRKPFPGTVAGNVLEHSTGALNINGCRISGEPLVTFDRIAGDRDREQWRTGTGENRTTVDRGRWPTNVVLDESQADELDKQTGILTSGANPTRRASDNLRETYGDFKGQEECTPARGANSGGASRFFPTFHYGAKAPASERPHNGEIAHPTVKPLDLMRWLVRLVTPPGGTVLEPFAGSGTTAEACVVEGFKCIAIEREADYLPLIVNRLSKPIQIGLNFDGGAA